MKYKTIHQSWSNKFLPIKFKKNQLVLKKYFKDCEFKLWTDDDNKNFIKNEFPDFYPIYDNYKNKINQVDSARFFYLYKYGGLYIDLDVLLIQNIKCLLDEDCCLFSQDSNKSYYATEANLPFFIDSMCMYSEPGNNFIGEIIEHLYKNEPINIVNVLDNVFLTGPGMLTNLYNKLKPTIKLNHNKIVVEDDLELYDNIYGIHYCTNTWVGKNYILNK